MSNLVIVALPAEDDYVNKISSEKQAYLTLLFLGEVSKVQNLDKIISYVEHAASLLTRFSLSVGRRGSLGPDEADVLFFDRWGMWDYKLIQDFRGQLLKDSNVKTAYDSSEQYDEWQPHLTLGYPTAPAHEDKRDYPGTRYVDFDRIAIWTEDYDGVEIPLNWERDLDIMAMNDPTTALLHRLGVRTDDTESRVEAILAHHGVKGMKWGVRKEAAVGAARSAGKKVAVGAKNVRFELDTLNAANEAHSKIVNEASEKYVQRDLPRLKAKHASTGADKLVNRLKSPLSKEARAYRKDAKAAYLKRLEQAANSQTNASGSRRYTLKEHGKPNTSQYFWGVSTEKVPVKHAEDDGTINVQPIFDADGFIVELKTVESSIAQSEAWVENFLSHHGIKGMKWGVRRDRGSDGRVVSEDAAQVKATSKKLKKHGKDSLSNQELQTLINRMNLERNLNSVQASKESKGKKMAKEILGNIAKQQVSRLANDVAAKQVESLLMKKR